MWEANVGITVDATATRRKVRGPAPTGQRGGGRQESANPMSAHAVDVLDADAQTRKRAQFEAFEFEVTGDDTVRIVNQSHSDATDHSYTVTVDSGVPTSCTCEAFQYHEGPCKHQVAVAINDPVLGAIEARQNPREECWCSGKELPCFAHYEGGDSDE